jgi:hypothetical protein
MDAASLSRRIAVRHKEPGHLRLELPPELFAAAARAHLEAGLRERVGVYRVQFEPEGRRLSIRFEPQQCSLGDVARQLRALLDALPAEAAEPSTPPPAADPLATARKAIEGGAREINARLRGLLERLRQPGAPAGSLQAKLQPMLKGALTEQATINFLNDVLVFYLIKVHWDLITKRWMKNPVAYADAWLAIFYLVFLLVRYRKSVK